VRYTYCMNDRSGFLFSLICLFFSLAGALQAQNEQPPGQSIGSTREDSITVGTTPLDEPVPMTYVLLSNPDEKHTFADTFQWDDNKHFPLRGYDAYLGNYGSATRSLAPTISSQIGFATGWNQYDPYYLHHESFRYYNQDVPVASIKYSQAGDEDTYLTLDFGRSFANGLSLSVAYRRINQVGDFFHQRQKDTGFSVGIWHDAPSGKYDAFYNYLNNAAVTQENGGVSDPDSIGYPRWPDESIPVYLSNDISDPSAVSTHKHRSFLTKQIYHVVADSSGIGMDIWLQCEFSTGLFKYVDEDILESAEDYYGPTYLIDDRGIRQYTFMRENEWSIGVALPWKAARSTINGSLRYRGIVLEQEPVKKNINEFYLDASGVFQWIEPLALKGNLSLGLGQAEGDYSFRAEANLDAGPIGHLIGHWAIASRKPYMIESTLYVNQQLIYNEDFLNPFTSEFGVTWDWAKQNLRAGVRWLVYDNYIYFDSISFPQQIDGSFSLRRIFLSKGFDFKDVGVKGSIFWQPDTPKELAVPEIWYTASLYGKVRFFDKELTVMPGMDINYNGGFTGISYFPVNGRYHLTDGMEIPDAFRVDLAIGLQVRFIKAFARFEDFVGLFERRALIQADYYPLYRGYFRFGLEAAFFN
jgi:hypothetical protein